MKTAEKWTKTERILLVLTLAFLICTGILYGMRVAGDRADYVVQTESGAGAVPPESVAEPEPEPEPPTPEHPLDLNTADAAALDLLPGIGETLAGRIVAYREEHGPFAAPEEIMKVEGIGEGTYADLRDLITVGEAVA